MNDDRDWMLRLAVLSRLVKDAPQPPGRTALMKFAYLLQTIKNVPLGYRFKLYNYGPYDSTVLSDLSQAVTMKAMKSSTVYFSSGYGYEYSTNDTGYGSLCKKVASDLERHAAAIDWVLGEFGTESASSLELISTIVFAEREMLRKGQEVSTTELCRRVSGIKPHFAEAVITDSISSLAEKHLISVTRN